MSDLVTTVTDDTFHRDVLESEQPVVVDFWAAWCGPCRVLSPLIEDLAAERPDVRFVKIDVDAEQEVAARYSVMAMPTMMVFRDGRPVLSLVGARPKKRLVADLAPAIGGAARSAA